MLSFLLRIAPRTPWNYSPLLPTVVSSASKFNFSITRAWRNTLILTIVTVVLLTAVHAFDLLQYIPSRTSLISGNGIHYSSSHASLKISPLLPLDSDSDSFSSDYLTLDELQELIAPTRGFFGRDVSLGLGWNNVRYIIEAALAQAQTLNRTLVIPSFVYARACEYSIHVCADQAVMVNKGDAIGWDQWRKLPIDQQMGFRIPMNVMINLTRLRQIHPTILVSEYLRLRGLPEESESSSGLWDRDLYKQPGRLPDGTPTEEASMYVIENHLYDPQGVLRVDVLPEDMKARGRWDSGDPTQPMTGRWKEVVESAERKQMQDALPRDRPIDYDRARGALKQLSFTSQIDGQTLNVDNDDDFAEILHRNGWEILYTFSASKGGEMMKIVTDPIRQVAPREMLFSLYEDFGRIDTEILVLAGETHSGRKPGNLRFTSEQARDHFQYSVLHHVVPTQKVYNLAFKLKERVEEMNGGRQLMGAHMRRGDFVELGWGPGLHDQIQRVKRAFANGRNVLANAHPYQPYNVPDILYDMSSDTREAPREDDRFFVATDERDANALQTLKDNGAILLHDLLTIEDRHELGWPLMFTDFIGVVEQTTLAWSDYFYGSSLSSFTGGVVNMRAVRGADVRTAYID